MPPASPARRALMWTLLPVLLILNLIAWIDLPRLARSPSVDAEQLLKSPFKPSPWLDVDASYLARLDQGLLPILVLRARDHTPVAGAPVWIFHQFGAPGAWWSSSLELRPKPARPADAHTDQRGIAWIAWTAQDFGAALALDPERPCSAGLTQSLGLSKPSEPMLRAGAIFSTVEIYPLPFRFALDLRGDEADSPGEYPVFLLNRDGSSYVPLFPDGDGQHWLGVVLPVAPADVDLYLETESWRLAVGSAGSPSVRVQRKHFHGRTLAVSVAQRGTLEIVLERKVEEPREPIPLRVEPAGTHDGPVASHSLTGAALWIDERLLVRGLPLGQRWRVGAPLLGDGRWFWTECEGPRSSGETETTRLGLDLNHRRVEGILLGLDDAPAANERIWGELRNSEIFSSELFALTTDARGAFSLHVPLHGEPVEGSTSLRTGSLAVGAAATIHWDAAAATEPVALGEVRLQSLDDGACVRIVNRNGELLPGTKVFLRPLTFQGWDETGPWTHHVAHAGSLFADDAISYGALPLEIVANHALHLWSKGILHAWDEPLILTMQPAARVRGRVLLPEAARVEVEVHPALTQQAPFAAWPDFEKTSATSPLGWFDCGPFYPGICDLELRIAGLLMARIGRVELREGETCAPPAFQGLDLRDCIPMRIVLTSAPKEIRNEHLRLAVEFEDGRVETLTGRALLLPPDARFVHVTAEHCEPVRLPVRAGAARLKLRKSAS